MPSIVNKVKHAPYGTFKKVLELCRWFAKASSIDHLDSPILYEFYCKVVKPKVSDPKVDEIERYRVSLLNDQTPQSLTDYGSGSYSTSETVRSISSITKSAVSDPRKCSLLYNICKYVNPKYTLELGTSLGISTMYLQAGAPQSMVTSVEGDPGLCALFNRSNLLWAKDIQVINDTFESAIRELSGSAQPFDLIYIDGSHHSESLLPLISSLDKIAHQGTWLIVDDIYWSRDMKKAWDALKSTDIYNLAIDMWYFGLLRYDDRLKESIQCRIPPLHLRWQMGFAR